MMKVTSDDVARYFKDFTRTALKDGGDSDRHLPVLFALASASRAKVIVELGVRDGRTTFPLLLAAALNGGKLISVDKKRPAKFRCPPKLKKYWSFRKEDALKFLRGWSPAKKIDFVYVDDWHAYKHVRQELKFLDSRVGPSSLIVLHDLMRGRSEPFYHVDLTLKKGQWAEGGPYRAVAELDPQFWEWATLPWGNGLTLLRKKYSSKYHAS